MFPSPIPMRDNLIGDKQSRMTTVLTEIHDAFWITQVFERCFSWIIFVRLRVLSHNKADMMILRSGVKNENIQH